MKNTLCIFLIGLLLSCSSSEKLLTATSYTSCQLIEKELVTKGAKITERKELYLRCSVQDYFIKICEGNVTEEDLIPYINSGIKVEMEIKEGIWDHCDENEAYAQSRTGTYVVINKIID